MPDDRNLRVLEEDLKYYSETYGFGIPIVLVLNNSHSYKPLKEMCYKYGFVSQGIKVQSI